MPNGEDLGTLPQGFPELLRQSYPEAYGPNATPSVPTQAGDALGKDIAGIGRGLLDFVRIPANVYRGQYTQEQIPDVARNFALQWLGMNLPGARLSGNELGIFGGSRSATAPLLRQEIAQSMERAGADPLDIHYNTGWFRSADGKWRYTIPDARAQFKIPGISETIPNSLTGEMNYYVPSSQWHIREPGKMSPQTTLGDILTHPELFESYPDLASVRVSPLSMEDALAGMTGGYSRASDQIWLAGGSQGNMMSSLLHELQHAVQMREDFARGGNTNEFLPKGFYENYKALNDTQDALLGEFDSTTKARLQNYVGNVLSNRRPSSNEIESWNSIPGATQEKLLDNARRINYSRYLRDQAYDKYNRLAGEAEARTVQEQFNLRDWSRMPQEYAYAGYTPYEEQIVRFGDPKRNEGMSPSLSLRPVDHDPFAQVSDLPTSPAPERSEMFTRLLSQGGDQPIPLEDKPITPPLRLIPIDHDPFSGASGGKD